MTGITMVWLIIGAFLAVLGAYGLVKGRVSVELGDSKSRYNRMRLRLVGGPAYLGGVALLLSGCVIAGPLAYGWMQTGEAALESVPTAALGVLVLGMGCAIAWQAGVNLRAAVAGKQVQARALRNAAEALAEEESDRES